MAKAKSEEGVWVLTSEYNDYDQHGEYFCCAWRDRPSVHELATYFKMGGEANVSSPMEALEFLLHLERGGGRQGTEEVWYNLKHVKFGESHEKPF